MNKKKKMSDVTKILIAMVAGSLVGIVLGEKAMYIEFIGTIWLNLMKMFLVPIVVCMIVKGISTMDDPKTLGRLGVRIISFYMVTTVIASVVGIAIAYIFKPGIGFDFSTANVGDVEIAELPGVGEFLVSMFSKNIFDSFSSANMMQVVIIAIIIGVAVVLLPEDKRKPVKEWFWSMTDLIRSIINIALKLAPIGVFCLMASALGQYGVGLLLTMSKLIGIFYLCCVIHFGLTYCMTLWAATGITPIDLLRKCLPTFATAVSTCSSTAVIPVSVDIAKDDFGVDDAVAGLGITLGGSINKDGTTILCGVVMLFSAQAMGITLTPGQMLNIVFLSTAVTCAGTSVPGAGIMSLMIVASAVGIPLEIIIMVSSFYRFFDMGTTTMNCMGDMAVTVMVDRMEKKRMKRMKTA